MALSNVPEDFNRAKAWLATNAPKVVELSLREPSNQDVRELLNIRNLPQDFISLYFQSDGLNSEKNITGLFFGLEFLPIKDILTDREIRSKQITNVDLRFADKGIKKKANGESRIVFGHDSASFVLALDLDPDIGGSFGQVIGIDQKFSVGLLLASSIGEMVTKFADDLEAGKYGLDEQALHDGHQFLSPVADIDVINWWKISKWEDYLPRRTKKPVAVEAEKPNTASPSLRAKLMSWLFSKS